jgi:hypothetical protein
MMKTKHIQWLVLGALLLFTAGCPVDVNEGTGGDDDGSGGTPECPKAELATVRIFHGAGGTPVTRPQFGPSSTRALLIDRPDLDPADPPVIATLSAGRAALVQVCSGKTITLGARLSGATADRITMQVTISRPDPDPSQFDAQETIVVAGIADTPDDMNPASMTNPMIFIEVPDTFSAGPETLIQVVHASRKLPTPIAVEVNPDTTGAEIASLNRYAFSGVVPTKGSTDIAPSSVPIVAQDPATFATKQSFTISPRIPASAKVVAILYDVEIYDPKNPDPTQVSPPPSAKLFVTGDDPLLGFVSGGGITF